MLDLRGVWAKMRWSRGLLALFLITLFWTLSLFIAPLTLPPGTFAWTVGGANFVDHWDIYEEPQFNYYAKLIYAVGDSQCHQLYYRSLWINGNQMPIDARMTSLYIFGVMGLFWAMMTPPALNASQGVANAFPARVRRWAERVGVTRFTALVLLLGIVPLGVDGFTQLFSYWTHYESTNATRILTGVSGGLVTGLLLGMMFKAITLFNITYRARAGAEGPANGA